MRLVEIIDCIASEAQRYKLMRYSNQWSDLALTSDNQSMSFQFFYPEMILKICLPQFTKFYVLR